MSSHTPPFAFVTVATETRSDTILVFLKLANRLSAALRSIPPSLFFPTSPKGRSVVPIHPFTELLVRVPIDETLPEGQPHDLQIERERPIFLI